MAVCSQGHCPIRPSQPMPNPIILDANRQHESVPTPSRALVPALSRRYGSSWMALGYRHEAEDHDLRIFWAAREYPETHFFPVRTVLCCG